MPQLEITNRLAEEAMIALHKITTQKVLIQRADKSTYEGIPLLSARVRMKMSKNLRKLKAVHDEKEAERLDAVAAHFGTTDPEAASKETKIKFQAELERILKKKVTVDIQTILIAEANPTGDESIISLASTDAPLDLSLVATLCEAGIFEEHESCQAKETTKS